MPAAVAGRVVRPGPGVAVFVALLIAASAAPAAAQVALGGGMRFDAADVAFTGGFGGLAVDVRRVEPYGYASRRTARGRPGRGNRARAFPLRRGAGLFVGW